MDYRYLYILLLGNIYSNTEGSKKKKKGFNDFSQRKYDFDELEREALQSSEEDEDGVQAFTFIDILDTE